MSVASRYLSCSLGVLLLLPAGLARGDGREGVEAYRSGEATVSLEWFAPADRGRFPTVVLLHPSGGMDPGSPPSSGPRAATSPNAVTSS